MTISQCKVHTWVLVEDETHYGCQDCEATAAACVECRKPREAPDRMVCDRCVRWWQKLVRDVHMWATTYQQDPYSPISSPRIDPNRVTTSDDDVRLPFGLDSVVSDLDDGRIESLRTVAEALEVLTNWAGRWAKHMNVTVGPESTEFLAEWTPWALDNRDASAWEVYAREARRVRALVRRLVGIAPEREPAPCVHCGGLIVREWEKDGLSELRRCTGCGIEWPEYSALMHTNHLVLQGLPETHPSMQVTLADAKRIYRGRIGPKLLHMWVKRGKLLAVDRDVRGDDLYLLGDVKALLEKSEAKQERMAKGTVSA